MVISDIRIFLYYENDWKELHDLFYNGHMILIDLERNHDLNGSVNGMLSGLICKVYMIWIVL